MVIPVQTETCKLLQIEERRTSLLTKHINT